MPQAASMNNGCCLSRIESAVARSVRTASISEYRVFTREPQRTRDLIGQQRALLEDVDSAIEESQCDLRAFAGACRRGDDDARDIDVVGQVVDARVTGDAVLRGDSA